ncbi:hypothetical protein ACFXK0_12380 [Nocardia sp. NPDC059177]|uniref:hypothetical protein n=1 Tax=Nocardia sp. NPDC059177 TaxID=3346759 RepID=UPI00369A77B7
MTTPIPVTVLGAHASLTDYLARRPEFELRTTAEPAELVGLVVHLPTAEEVTDGTAAETATRLLRAGHDVVTTTPLDPDAVRAACAAGRSTFHATGGLPTALVVRVCRAFAGAWRDIDHVVLTEFRDPAERTVPEADYEAGLRALAAAVFPDADTTDSPTISTTYRDNDIHVSRTLGPQVAYNSSWAPQDNPGALRYRLTTVTAASGAGHTTFRFDTGTQPHIIDHLVAVGVRAAIAPTWHGTPGILLHDFTIDHVQPDDRLTR